VGESKTWFIGLFTADQKSFLSWTEATFGTDNQSPQNQIKIFSSDTATYSFYCFKSLANTIFVTRGKTFSGRLKD
jgi:hypothetical protein